MKNERFEEYFLRYKNLVIRIVMNKTGDYQAAQEICQQVFIAFYKNMEKVSPELVKAWLIRSTKNAVVDYIRKNKTKEKYFVENSCLENGNILIEESVEVYEEKRSNRELVSRILREVRKVNKHWFEVLMMHCVEGLSYTEAAKELNISESVLRARMYRARLFVREHFGEEYMNL